MTRNIIENKEVSGGNPPFKIDWSRLMTAALWLIIANLIRMGMTYLQNLFF